jgi:cytidylate kinase
MPGSDPDALSKHDEQSKPASARRTTVALSARAAEIVERFQEAAGISMSDAISELIERSEEAPARIKIVDGIPMADVPLTGKWITNEDVIRAQAELG